MAEAKAPGTRPEDIRPLSPHLQIYRWTWTMAMSVVHRVTGSALYVGTLLLVAWLLALASGPEAFETAQWFFGSFLGRLILFGYTWTLLHHMFGGIRHLIWDVGLGFDAAARQNLARMTLIASATLTLLVWVVGYAVS
ncbi:MULTISPECIES: succinate dehydrogenase, cytochrome b556 subunit [Chelatococcus]|uniref:Succinate dehydrogenase cytochrome b556 subunit n=1 Tax=Chelatococcus caeni TaxID=1348468 RepID=A0A840C2R4_9HYPH|nr:MULTISPECIES: succinate dehydrogenase, cytochrome b556 subunit [Chelatococcus]ALA17506.1 succinate dehydrogenase [Chelatococcus sp. CO-6]MBB4019113.1 succinate dehydrogenase / fumarate reductase cytochrome b subunit [Chelatococcus caeni]